MSTFLGKADSVAIPAALNIQGSTNATPIEVTTTADHGLVEDEIVQITGHTGNLAANGIWRAHVTATNKLQLLVPYTSANSVGSGVGGAQGVVQPMSISPSYAIPADGQKRNAASVNAAFEKLGDRTKWAEWRLLTFPRRSGTAFISVEEPTWAAWSTGSCTNAGWTEDAAATGLISMASDLDVVDGDEIQVRFGTTYDTTIAGGGPAGIALFAATYEYGAAPSFATAAMIAGSAVKLYGGVDTRGPLLLHGRTTLPIPHGKKLRIYIGVLGMAAGATNYNLRGDRQFSVEIWR